MLSSTCEKDFDLDEDEERFEDEDDEMGGGSAKPPVGPVDAPRFPRAKDEGWWLVVGDTASKRLLGIKRVPLQHSAQVKVDFHFHGLTSATPTVTDHARRLRPNGTAHHSTRSRGQIARPRRGPG